MRAGRRKLHGGGAVWQFQTKRGMTTELACLDKLRLHNRAEAVGYALRNKMVEPEGP